MVISINPSQSWQGNDGPWSTFTLGIGTPAQWVQVLISTTGVQPWVILSQGCTPTDPPTCGKSRGNIFYINQSSTWQDEGLYELDLELNLGYTGSGDFGYDTLSLGLLGTGLPNMSHQVIAGIAAKDFYLGSWGISPYPTNLTTLDDPKPSLMSDLKEKNLISSLSYGYTAGAQYRLKGVLGSLTLGGYDASLFTPSSTSFGFAADTSRDLVVGIKSISMSQSAMPTVDLLPTSILSFIDSTVPQIWLPIDACHEFERAFGISYDDGTGLYLVNDTLHDSLVARDASLTFTIATDTTSDEIVNITLPYASFDLHVSYPIVQNGSSRYFPIRRAENSTQYTLGRTFLQEA
ncbi:Aspartic peptidase domain [Lasallia pustulata]|uniref:Aspartic peptidase domain n=1 Tax=Lasallia pustulata TaxID=136370 RepID=A0A1W5DCB4_9LECA|nr:Aspartic peptidase domain [Lasallia pustulata]